MAKLYTLDGKLLVDKPEIRIGDKCYAVDDRVKTVKKAMKVFDGAGNDIDKIDEALKLLLGAKAFGEIEALELSWAAYQKLLAIVIAAATGEEPEKIEERFQEPAEK